MSRIPNLADFFLHLYSGFAHHDDAAIVGNREGLTALRDALTALLDTGALNFSFPAFTADGEGYELLLTLVRDNADLEAYVLPYTADYAVPITQTQAYNDHWPRKPPRPESRDDDLHDLPRPNPR